MKIINRFLHSTHATTLGKGSRYWVKIFNTGGGDMGSCRWWVSGGGGDRHTLDISSREYLHVFTSTYLGCISTSDCNLYVSYVTEHWASAGQT